jgi:ADP-heptose:LPS heptosyltransferase
LLSTQPRKILLPRFDTIGDIVLLEGFLEALLQRFPEAKVTLLIRRVYADLACLFPDSLDWLTTEIDPHRQPPDLSLCKKLLEDLGGSTWDLALVTAHNRTWADDLVAAGMTGSTSLAIGHWTKMPSAYRRLFGELGLSADCPYQRSVPVSEKSHEIEKYQILWYALTGESALPEPKLYVNEHQKLVAEKLLHFIGLEIKDFCLCFPAGTQKVAIKTWPPDRFAEIIAWLEAERGVKSLVAGHRSEAGCVEEVVRIASAKGARPEKWLGRDGEIPILAALVQAAKFYLGNDTGPMHMAAAVNTPVVAICGGGAWPKYIPRGDSSIAIAGEMPCFGCGWDCIFEDAPCMSLVSVEDVKSAITSLDDGTAKEHVLPASMRLSDQTKWYIGKAVKTQTRINADRRELWRTNFDLEITLKESEADRSARLKQLEESEADGAARLEAIEKLERQLVESEADRAARLAEMERLGKQLAESEADRAARLEVIHRLGAQLSGRESRVRELEAVRNHVMVRLLIKLRLIREPKI